VPETIQSVGNLEAFIQKSWGRGVKLNLRIKGSHLFRFVKIVKLGLTIVEKCHVSISG
jgi:hypothetical protein